MGARLLWLGLKKRAFMHFRPQAALQKRSWPQRYNFSSFFFSFSLALAGIFERDERSQGEGCFVLPEEHRLEGGGRLAAAPSGNHGRRGTRSGSRRSDHREDARAPRGVLGGGASVAIDISQDLREEFGNSAVEEHQKAVRKAVDDHFTRTAKGVSRAYRREEEGRPARDRRASREEEGEDHGVGLCLAQAGGHVPRGDLERSLPRPSSTTERSF